MRLRNYLLLVTLFLASCAAPDTQHHIVISTRDQKLALLDRGQPPGDLSGLHVQVWSRRSPWQQVYAAGTTADCGENR